MDLPKDFYKLVEEPGYLKSVVYGDTDSLFVIVKKNMKNLLVKKAIKHFLNKSIPAAKKWSILFINGVLSV